MERLTELTPVFCKYLPAWKAMEHGYIYISEEFGVSNHLCACGCGQQTVLPFNAPGDWTMVNNNGKVTFSPSVGNFNGESPYHAHYFITENKIIWC